MLLRAEQQDSHTLASLRRKPRIKLRIGQQILLLGTLIMWVANRDEMNLAFEQGNPHWVAEAVSSWHCVDWSGQGSGSSLTELQLLSCKSGIARLVPSINGFEASELSDDRARRPVCGSMKPTGTPLAIDNGYGSASRPSGYREFWVAQVRLCMYRPSVPGELRALCRPRRVAATAMGNGVTETTTFVIRGCRRRRFRRTV